MTSYWLPAVIVLVALAMTVAALLLVRRSRRRRLRPAGREVVIKVERM